MELILLKDVTKVGRKGDVVRVRDGFARNFLIPQRLALSATRSNQIFFEEQRVRSQKRQAQEREEARRQAEKMSDVKVVIKAQAGAKDKLFGSVTAEQISEALKKQGYSFEKKQIHLKGPLRSLGSYPVSIDLYPQVKATITVEIVPKKK